MKIELWLNGKTEPYVAESCERFAKRLTHYAAFQITEVPEPKRKGNTDTRVLKQQEAQLLLPKIDAGDYLVLLDDKGKEYHSEGFAAQVEKWMGSGRKRLIFMVGGPYGFDDTLYARADETLSLSKMTFSHQVIRVIFLEQLYRAFTIINNEPYHHA